MSVQLSEKIPVMQGPLSDIDLASVIQVVSIGRQFTSVELRDDAQRTIGTIFIKSGKVVGAVTSDARGREAFYRFFQAPGRPQPTTFHVFRSSTPSGLPEPLGPVGDLLLEAIDRASQVQRRDEEPTGRRPSIPRPGQVEADAEGPPTPPAVPRPGPPPARRSISIAVASPKGGCGKTTLSLNLSLSLARQGRSIVLVDGDINSDVLSAVDARENATAGVFDVLTGHTALSDALLTTVFPNLRILPAMGQRLPESIVSAVDLTSAWTAMISELGESADVVIVDTPAGMFGVTQQIMASCSHVLGVLQSEILAQRSFERFDQGLSVIPEVSRPQVLGVFINMLQTTETASVHVLERACQALPPSWLFETTIPRSNAFLEASSEGLPLRLMDEDHPPPVTWLFETLASEVSDRLELPRSPRRRRRLLS